MKKFIYFVSIIFYMFCIYRISFGLSYQDLNIYQNTVTREYVEKKLNFLIGDSTLKNYFSISDLGLTVFSDTNKKKVEFFLSFGTKQKPENNKSKINKKDNLFFTGIRIAIDPGHLGGDMAFIEERFVALDPILPDKKKLEFDEGTLAVATAQIIAEILKSFGATVMLTHENPGQSVYNQSFADWCSKELGVKSSEDWEKTEIQEKILNFLIKKVEQFNSEIEKKSAKNRLLDIKKHQLLDRSLLLQRAVFRLCYNYLDLQARTEKINNFKPDITLIIHYNAMDNGYVRDLPINKCINYNLTFIPGNFMAGELSAVQSRIEFVRLLVSDDFENSLKLSKAIATNMPSFLKVPLLDSKNYLNGCAKFVDTGVYARNLVLTRTVHAPICYGETLIQNCYEEAKRLAEKSIIVKDIKTTPRVIEVAFAYIAGIFNFYELDLQANLDKLRFVYAR